ncbi:hypothetical protein [Bremerella cremea]|uniref:hypothetical protein n=1 Tax=Bremerella cremea TaxID=1031537 RepID=UPI0011C03FEB|nr:hypothetical protein [Bremerella cremea]
MRILLVLIASFLSMLVSFSEISAAEFLSGREVTVAADEIWEGDLYISAQSVNVAGTVKGDLVVFSQALHVTGQIEGGVFAAAQQVLLEGECARTCRIACQAAEVGAGAQLGGDLVVAAYSLEIKQDAVISGDLIYAGFQAMLKGEIEQDVWAAVNRAELLGQVKQELSITTASSHTPDWQPLGQFWPGTPLVSIPQVKPGLTIDAGATIGSKLIYHSPEEANIAPQANITGPIEWIEPEPPLKPENENLNYFWQQVKRFLTILAMGVLMIVVCPHTTGGIVEQILQRPIASFLAGLIAVPLAVVLSAIVLALIVAVPMAFGWLHFDGLAVAGSLIASLAAVLYLGSVAFYFVFGAAVVTCITLGCVVFSDQRMTSRWALIVMLGFGLIFYIVLTCVPYLNVGIIAAAILFAFGGIFLWCMGKVLKGGQHENSREAAGS